MEFIASYKNKKSLIAALLLSSTSVLATPIFEVATASSTAMIGVNATANITYTVKNVSGTTLTLSSVVPKLENSESATAVVTTTDCANTTLVNNATCTDNVLLTGVTTGANTLNFWAYTFNGTVGSKASVDMAFEVGDYNYAFVVNSGTPTTDFSHNSLTSTSGSISRCKVDASTGVFSQCADTGGVGFDAPVSVSFNALKTRAFVVNEGTNNLFNHDLTPISYTGSISRCDYNESAGAFSHCEETGGTGFSAPTALAFNSTGTRAYIVSGFSSGIIKSPNGVSDNLVTACDVDTNTGAFSGCFDTGATNIPTGGTGITFNPAGTVAFITGLDFTGPVRCDVNSSTGMFTGCADSIYTESLYTLENNSGISHACLNPTDDYSGCGSLVGLTFNLLGTKAFLTDKTAHRAVSCDVDISTGNFTNCVYASEAAFNYPWGIRLNASGTQAFFVNNACNDGFVDCADTVSRCDVDSDTGVFSHCSDTGGEGFSYPKGITLL